MRVAVVGATGTAGSRAAAAAEARGHEVARLSRATGVDLRDGTGLRRALEGADVVLDTSNAFPDDPRVDLVDALAGATRHLVEASLEAGVGHLVALSICNLDDPGLDGFPYYVAKREQERVVQESGLPHTVVRSTQWYEFAAGPPAVRFGAEAVEVEDWLVQPVAVASVAEVLVQEASHRSPRRCVAGPEVARLPDLTARLLGVRGDPRPVRTVAAPLPALAEGALLAPEGAEILGPDVATWLGTL